VRADCNRDDSTLRQTATFVFHLIILSLPPIEIKWFEQTFQRIYWSSSDKRPSGMLLDDGNHGSIL